MKGNQVLPIITLTLVLFISCSNATKEPWFSMQQKSVGVTASEASFKIDNVTIDDSLRAALDTGVGIDSLANSLFEQVIIGFSQSYTKDIMYQPNVDEADIILTIDSVAVSKGFTINITRPGPIYKAKVFVSSSGENSNIINAYEGNENFAEMFGEDKAFYQPEEKELKDPKKQKMVILSAIRDALGKAYADFLGIKGYM